MDALVNLFRNIDGIFYVIYVVVILFFILALIGYLSERNKNSNDSLNNTGLDSVSDTNKNSNSNNNVITALPEMNQGLTNISNATNKQAVVQPSSELKSDINSCIPINSQISTQLAQVVSQTQNNQINNVNQGVVSQVVLQPQPVAASNNQANNSINAQPVITINETNNK